MKLTDSDIHLIFLAWRSVFGYRDKIPVSEITEKHIDLILQESDSEDEFKEINAFDSDYEPFEETSDESEDEEAGKAASTSAPTPSSSLQNTLGFFFIEKLWSGKELEISPALETS
ncbi:hypothetical protein RN001_002385 [Aquatica leii]|uniref:Uncharacterized protein n=1 Tax=Aquatica leii TaxID=1421715 RepID=A0AAN7Q570_9COLE|nr:hypothetical protein RN001_002385 [Aquatica leii]